MCDLLSTIEPAYEELLRVTIDHSPLLMLVAKPPGEGARAQLGRKPEAAQQRFGGGRTTKPGQPEERACAPGDAYWRLMMGIE